MFERYTLSEIHHFCVIWMTAIIWLVQLILYPAFREIRDESFVRFHEFHSARISFLVAAPMLLQLFISAGMVLTFPQSREWWIHLICALVIFKATLFLSIPEHNRLKKGKDLESIERMIRTNWYRTIVWTFQCIFIILKW